MKLMKFLMTTNAVQCELCHNGANVERIFCQFLGATDEVKKQVLGNVLDCFNVITTRASVVGTGNTRRKTIGGSETS